MTLSKVERTSSTCWRHTSTSLRFDLLSINIEKWMTNEAQVWEFFLPLFRTIHAFLDHNHPVALLLLLLLWLSLVNSKLMFLLIKREKLYLCVCSLLKFLRRSPDVMKSTMCVFMSSAKAQRISGGSSSRTKNSTDKHDVSVGTKTRTS